MINARRDAEILLWCFPDRVLLIGGVATMPWSVALEHGRIRVIGACCSDHGCSELARWTCHWPGQTGIKCGDHAAAWTRVAASMGFELISKPIDVPVGLDDTEQRFSLLELH